MTPPRFLDDLGLRLDEVGARLSELAANSPARDIEKNFKAVLVGAFGKLDLVSREEFDVQRELLAKALERLSALESRVAELETRKA
jgi:BMFP domain-containing protein YqiC